MMHGVAFSQSIDEGGVATNITGVPDPSVRVNVNDIIVPDVVRKIIGAIALTGTTATRTVLQSPSLRRINPYEIEPLQLLLVPQAISRLFMHPESPTELDYNEALNAQVTADPGAAEQQTVGVFLSDGPVAKVAGKINRVRFSTTLALVAGQWVNAAINFIDVLPVGVYTLVGSNLIAPSATLARWYPVGGKWRPMFPVAQTRSDRIDDIFRQGGLGAWFDFDETQPPTIDVLSSAAAGSTTYFGVMDLIAK